MLTFEDLELGGVIEHKESGITWIILAIYDGQERKLLPGTPLLSLVSNVPLKPYVVLSIFSVKHRCDDGMAAEITLTDDFYDKYTKLNIPLVMNYNDMTFD